MLSFNSMRTFRARFHHSWMTFALIVLVIIPFVLLLGLYYKSKFLFQHENLWQLLTSSVWRPMSGEFGFLPFIISSLWVTLIALIISAPFCILTAIHITQYARKFILRIMHPVIDILAGIPSVVYGVWGVLVVVPLVSEHIAPLLNKPSSGYSILAGSIVLAVMIIPFVLNILIEIFRNIPSELSEASLSLGATKWQTIKKVLMRKAFPGIVAAFGLGMSRAFGETMAVLMVVGNVVKIPENVIDPGYPLPALIANNYGEMLSIPLYDSALMFAALLLFAIVILFNFLSRLLIIRLEDRI